MLKIIASIFSYIFHPLLLLTYLLLMIMLINPYLFGHTSFEGHNLLLIQIFFSTALLPSIAILVMKALGMLESLRMEDRQERIGPFIVSGIFYLWIFINVRDNGEIPLSYRGFVLAATVALFLSFLINLIQKVNIHAVSAGILLSSVIIMLATYSYSLVSLTSLLMGAIIFTGMVGTSQLILKQGEPIDIYGGFFIGFIAQAVALFFVFSL
jgi:hypothetical protein